MIYILIAIAILLLIGCFNLIYRFNNKNREEKIQEINDRILVLEKRIEDYKKDIEDDRKKEYIKIYENLTLNNQDITRIIKELNNLRKKRENEKK